MQDTQNENSNEQTPQGQETQNSMPETAPVQKETGEQTTPPTNEMPFGAPSTDAKSGMPKSRLYLIISLGVALLVVLGIVLFMAFSGEKEELPPKLSLAGTQGFIGTGLYLEFDASDITRTALYDQSEKTDRQNGVRYYFAEEEMSFEEVIESIEPSLQNKCLIAYYDAEEKSFYTYPMGPFAGTKMVSDAQLASYTVPEGGGFNIICKDDYATWNLLSAEDQPSETLLDIEKMPEGWNLASMRNSQSLRSTASNCANRLKAVWVMSQENVAGQPDFDLVWKRASGADRFEAEDLADLKLNDDYYLVWFNLEGNANSCTALSASEASAVLAGLEASEAMDECNALNLWELSEDKSKLCTPQGVWSECNSLKLGTLSANDEYMCQENEWVSCEDDEDGVFGNYSCSDDDLWVLTTTEPGEEGPVEPVEPPVEFPPALLSDVMMCYFLNFSTENFAVSCQDELAEASDTDLAELCTEWIYDGYFAEEEHNLCLSLVRNLCDEEGDRKRVDGVQYVCSEIVWRQVCSDEGRKVTVQDTGECLICQSGLWYDCREVSDESLETLVATPTERTPVAVGTKEPSAETSSYITELKVDPYSFSPGAQTNNSATISFTLSQGVALTVDVVDTDGKTVASLIDGIHKRAGAHTLVFWGRENNKKDGELFTLGYYKIKVIAEDIQTGRILGSDSRAVSLTDPTTVKSEVPAEELSPVVVDSPFKSTAAVSSKSLETSYVEYVRLMKKDHSSTFEKYANFLDYVANTNYQGANTATSKEVARLCVEMYGVKSDSIGPCSTLLPLVCPDKGAKTSNLVYLGVKEDLRYDYTCENNLWVSDNSLFNQYGTDIVKTMPLPDEFVTADTNGEAVKRDEVIPARTSSSSTESTVDGYIGDVEVVPERFDPMNKNCATVSVTLLKEATLLDVLVKPRTNDGEAVYLMRDERNVDVDDNRLPLRFCGTTDNKPLTADTLGNILRYGDYYIDVDVKDANEDSLEKRTVSVRLVEDAPSSVQSR